MNVQKNNCDNYPDKQPGMHRMQNGSREDAVLEGYRCTNPSCGGPLMPDPGMS